MRRTLGPIRSNLDGTASVSSGLGHVVLDLGAEAFTNGRPHPMLDPTVRRQQLLDSVRQPEVAVVLCDVILGWGAHSDPGAALATAWQEAKALVRAAGREVIGIATVCGTVHDPQDYERQCRVLRAQGILLAESNAQAVRLAAAAVGTELDEMYANFPAETPSARLADPAGENITSDIPTSLAALFSHGPRVINLGLETFATQLMACGVPVVHVDWRPPTGGDSHLARILERLR